MVPWVLKLAVFSGESIPAMTGSHCLQEWTRVHMVVDVDDLHLFLLREPLTAAGSNSLSHMGIKTSTVSLGRVIKLKTPSTFP